MGFGFFHGSSVMAGGAHDSVVRVGSLLCATGRKDAPQAFVLYTNQKTRDYSWVHSERNGSLSDYISR
ncbi:MAG: hypothetical protein C5B50_26200 [Verrucomicrobia bacterium]|nr:MAG: hypothetical protein C5B50_26200 [Verrucomicrobiota bacterium]